LFNFESLTSRVLFEKYSSPGRTMTYKGSDNADYDNNTSNWYMSKCRY